MQTLLDICPSDRYSLASSVEAKYEKAKLWISSFK